MLKTLALSASVLALAGGLALAEMSSHSTNHWLASDVHAMFLELPNTRLAMSPNLTIESNGSVTAAIIGVGGFLGVGKKDSRFPSRS
jgi:hypothetical protein